MESSKEKIEAQLCAYIDGDLTDAERVEIEQHLSSNPQHRKLMEELRGHSMLLRALPRATVPGELNESLTGQLERTALLDPTDDESSEAVLNINRWPQITAVAAVLLLAIGLGVVVYYVLPTDHGNRGTVAVDEKALRENGRTTDGLASNWQKDQPTDNRAWSAKPGEAERKDGDGAESKKGLDAVAGKDAAMKPGLGADRGSGLSYGRSSPNAEPAVDDAARRGMNDALLKSSRDLVSDKEVAQLREQLGRSLGQANVAAEGDKRLYLFVTTPQAAVANGQVKSYFNTNNIVYMDADLNAALADADVKPRGDVTADATTFNLKQAGGGGGFGGGGFNENSGGRAMAEEPSRGGFAGAGTSAGSGGASKMANGAPGGAGGGGGGLEGAIPAPNQSTAAATPPAPAPEGGKARAGEAVLGAKVANQPEGNSTGKRTDTEAFGGGIEVAPLGLKGSRRTSNPTDGTAAGAERDLALRSTGRAEHRTAEKAKVSDPAASVAADAPPAARPLDEAAATTGVAGQQTAQAAPGSLSANMFRRIGPGGAAVQEEARGRNGGGGVILARMNRRQAVELSNVLSREKGQLAELRDPAATVKLHANFEYNNDYAADIDADGRTRLGTKKEDAVLRQQLQQQQPARPAQGLEMEGAKKTEGMALADSATPSKPTEYGVRTPRAAAAPTSREAVTDKYAARWNVPATVPANGAGAVDALRLAADPLDEPVDVVIIVKDAGVATTPVVPTLTEPAGNVPAPAEKAVGEEKAK